MLDYNELTKALDAGLKLELCGQQKNAAKLYRSVIANCADGYFGNIFMAMFRLDINDIKIASYSTALMYAATALIANNLMDTVRLKFPDTNWRDGIAGNKKPPAAIDKFFRWLGPKNSVSTEDYGIISKANEEFGKATKIAVKIDDDCMLEDVILYLARGDMAYSGGKLV